MFGVMMILLLVLIILDQLVVRASADYCEPSDAAVCGNGVEILYPFYAEKELVNDSNIYYCGYKDLSMRCSDSDPQGRAVMNISNHLYFVQNIEPTSISLMDVDLDGKKCPLPRRNLSLQSTPSLQFSTLSAWIYFFYNCSTAPRYAVQNLPCLDSGNTTKRSFAFFESKIPKGFNWFGNCEETVRVPTGYNTIRSYNVSVALKLGFHLSVGTSECYECQNSGGNCSFNATSGSTSCSCPGLETFSLLCPNIGPPINAGLSLPIGRNIIIGLFAGLRGGILLILLVVYRKIWLSFLCQWGTKATIWLSFLCQWGLSFLCQWKTKAKIWLSFLYQWGLPFLCQWRTKAKIWLSFLCQWGLSFLCQWVTKAKIWLSFLYQWGLSFLCQWRTKASSTTNVEVFLENYRDLALQKYKYSDVKKMTNSFKDALGKGAFGSVFKGELHDGRLVAVKVLNGSKSNGEEFINEVATIGRTNHINVVSLLGFCAEGNKRALVYEFMPNGSLERFIYNNVEVSTSSTPSLGSEMLYQITLGIAKGLEYLHYHCNTRILHFDIKPHNILLDRDFCPKISDFGLAKLCPTRESVISMVGARGTTGYIAPEFSCRNFGGVSHKSDVYSYGMMVLEMIGRRKNIDVTVENISEIYFPHWIYNHLNREIVVDGPKNIRIERLGETFEDETTKKMIIIALWCIQTHPNERPSTRKVVEMLEGNLEELQMPPSPFQDPPTRFPTSTT